MNKEEELKFLDRWLIIRNKMAKESKLKDSILIRDISTFERDTNKSKQEIARLTEEKSK